MRRVLVPLDGGELAESILPDALRLSGPDGSLILINDATGSAGVGSSPRRQTPPEYLETVAGRMRSQGARVECHLLKVGDAAIAIDDAVERFRADMLAVATHGRSPTERWQTGGIAWRALLRSTVPVLIRHGEGAEVPSPQPDPRRILVPLDGSALAEKALPLAEGLARDWDASLWLVSVVPEGASSDPMPVTGSPASGSGFTDFGEADAYLRDTCVRLSHPAETRVLMGETVPALAAAAQDLKITDIVMTSHGRTGLSRVIVGTVADDLIHRLHCPIVILPPLVTLAASGGPTVPAE